MTEYDAALAGRLPKDGNTNGLSGYAETLAEQPTKIRAAVILFDVDKIVEDVPSGTHKVTARIRRIEMIQRPLDVTAVQDALVRALEERTGQKGLPIELASQPAGDADSEATDE